MMNIRSIALMLAVCMGLSSGYSHAVGAKGGSDMKTLKIKWQRLVTDNKTCPRCDSTEQELEKVISTLKKSFAPLGIKVVLQKDTLSLASFKKDPSQSNRIWINDVPLETWISAETGQSACCDVCGDSECRTVEIEGQAYETVPADLIIRAGLVAASQVLGPEKNQQGCEGSSVNNESSGGCCPK